MVIYQQIPAADAAAARRGLKLALAGVLGSVAYNATATLGVAALIRPLIVIRISGPAWAAAALPLVLLLAASSKGRISRLTGVALLCFYAVYLSLTLA
ncbi:MAG TPA: hypothetical protein VKL22_05890 [Actinomycetota bacterium]|nr:hypothetical protein [Actinomycetota bacterium]